MTEVRKIESDVKEKCLPALIKPEILNSPVSIFLTCTNCKKPITVSLGEQTSSCKSCHRRIVTKNLGIGFLGNMGIINGETLPLTFFADAVSEFLNKDVHKYMGKPVEFDDELLDMDGTIDIPYTAVSNVITNFRLHDDEPGNI